MIRIIIVMTYKLDNVIPGKTRLYFRIYFYIRDFIIIYIGNMYYRDVIYGIAGYLYIMLMWN